MRSDGTVRSGVRPTWARSTVYGSSVALGPTQALVYRYAWGMTEGGRRPEVTLARIAADLGKPVSSVHAALGRLRALGLLGVSARMGRTGGHRLWRVARSAAMSGALNVARHRRAIARIMSTWHHAAPGRRSRATEDQPVPDPPAPGLFDTVLPPSDPSRTGRPFGEAMRDAGFRPWWEEASDDATNRHPEPDTDRDSGSGGKATTYGLRLEGAGSR